MRFRKPQAESYAIEPDYSVPLAGLFDITAPATTTGETEALCAAKLLAIHKNDEALAWRIALIENAQYSIDAQYYSWHADISGQWLISKLIEAADRGVWVRLLLDDIHTLGADRRIATLNRHKNIEVRIFNAFKHRWSSQFFRIFELLWNLKRLNHRMHNKLLIADNLTAIIGGRNIGDEYFSFNKTLIFRDLDLLVCGDAVERFSHSFDLFWNNPISKTARRLIAFRPGRLNYRRMLKHLDQNILLSQQIIQHIESVKNGLLKNADLKSRLISTHVEIVFDLPAKNSSPEESLAQELNRRNLKTTKQLTVISAYFIPSQSLLASFKTLLDNGVRIQVLTNSLASIDVTAIFTGYERYRHQLLNMGVELYEFRAEPEYHPEFSSCPAQVDFFSLHAKSIIYDSDSVYIGTLNLDPRSEFLNTEIGMFINNNELTTIVHNTFIDDLNDGKYWQVKYNKEGKLIWQYRDEVRTRQPARSFWQRVRKTVIALLPIQQHL
ncbi:MAG: phospholipase D family protein [Gammaproteobacteria bacterium]|nr:phospholipase D family protein [Gammaproteobacteria bacterium]